MTNSHGYVLEYPRIRVDHFDQAPVPLPSSILAHRRSVGVRSDLNQAYFEKPLLYLLTHIHTDHLKGLDRPGITAPIYCSFVTKNLLLRYERQKTRIEGDRNVDDKGRRDGAVRPYAHLHISEKHATAKSKRMGFKASPLDLLRPLPYNTPTEVHYTPKKTIMLTLIESNHMFGGTMFLLQGDSGAVLHTGDLRAEAWWCDALVRNPVLSQYVSWSNNPDGGSGQSWAEYVESLGSEGIDSSIDYQDSIESCGTTSSQGFSKSNKKRTTPLHLENIYLDTELLFCNQEVPSKQQACQDMISLMQLYPKDTVFFLNAWTWGYEDMLIATAKAFGCKVHVDRFKHGMYKAAKSEIPFLSEAVTGDASKTRFHACEKRNTCESLLQLTTVNQREMQPLLVYVNPGQVSTEQWPKIYRDTTERLLEAQRGQTAWPEAMIVPIERHSTLPELQNFVKLFRPRTVSPNTILDPKGGLDYYLLHHLFGHLLHSGTDQDRLAKEGLAMLGDKTWAFYEAQIALAQQEAAKGAGESTEAHHSGSASWHESAQGGDASLDAAQFDRLCKIRGMSFKGIIMHNMAGKLAAMLEVERWMRAEETPDDIVELQNELQESLSSDRGTSIASVNYDADHSQFVETQACVHPTEVHTEQRRDETEVKGTPSAAQVSSREADSFSQQSAESMGERPTVLTDDLAYRYINVLIHHFKVPFDRTTAKTTYVEMWTNIRLDMAEQAQKVEEHYFREHGLLPPLWASPASDQHQRSVHFDKVPNDQAAQELQAESSVVDDADSLDEKGATAAAETLSAFVDMLDMAGAQSAKVLLPPSRIDRVVALRLIMKHFRQLGFANDSGASSSVETQPKCVNRGSIWMPMKQPMSRLAEQLVSELSAIPNQRTETVDADAIESRHAIAKQQLSEHAIQATGVLLAFRTFHSLIAVKSLQSLVSSLLTIVEDCDLGNTSNVSKERGRLVELACAALRHEELPEDVLAPLEPRLIALATDAENPLRRALLRSDVESSESSKVTLLPTETVSAPPTIALEDQFWSRGLTPTSVVESLHQPQAERADIITSVSGQSVEDSVESYEASIMQIRHPVPALQYELHNKSSDRRSARQHTSGQNDNAETQATTNGISQGSSVTQEEESTEEESQSAPATLTADLRSVQHVSRQAGSTGSTRNAVPLSTIGRLLRSSTVGSKQSLKRVHSEDVALPAKPTLKIQRSASQQARPVLNAPDENRPSRTRSSNSRMA